MSHKDDNSLVAKIEETIEKIKNCSGCRGRRERLKKELADLKTKLGV